MSTTSVFFIITIARYVLVGIIFYVAYLMGKDHVNYYGWLIFAGIIIALLGGYSFQSVSTVTCPKCGFTFKVDLKDKEKEDVKLESFMEEQNDQK